MYNMLDIHVCLKARLYSNSEIINNCLPGQAWIEQEGLVSFLPYWLRITILFKLPQCRICSIIHKELYESREK